MTISRLGIPALENGHGGDSKDKLYLGYIVMLAMNASSLQPAPDPTPCLPEGVSLQSSIDIGSALKAASPGRSGSSGHAE